MLNDILADTTLILNVLQLIFVIIVVVILGIEPLLDLILGREKIEPKVEELTPFSLKSKTDEELIITAILPLVNEGRQCGTIMDAILRVQLPYEQYDGIEARGKVDLRVKPREDDYFEAVLIERGERLEVELSITLKPRRGLSLEEAIASMVDIGMDFIYQETGRTPCHYSKRRLELRAADLRNITGVKESVRRA